VHVSPPSLLLYLVISNNQCMTLFVVIVPSHDNTTLFNI
jgi:hypothetical protein